MSSSNQRPANRGFRSVLRCAISHYRQSPSLSAPEPAEALLESMPTKLFLANPELPEKAAETFRLNPSEVNTIRGLIPKRELYLRRPDAAGILRLEVDPASYWLYTSSPVDAAKRAEAVHKYGLTEAIEHLARR